MLPEITGLYAVPLTILMIALSTHVTMLRAKSGISIMDGGNTDLALRIRRHGNFMENAPVTLLLMLLAEVLGASVLWMHGAGALLLAGRLLHVVGLNATKAATFPRIAGGIATTIAKLICVGNILAHLMAA